MKKLALLIVGGVINVLWTVIIFTVGLAVGFETGTIKIKEESDADETA